MNKYYNYHKHDHKGNPFSLDVTVKLEDFCQRAIELGHDAIFTTCHGFQGDIFEATTLAHQYNLKLIVGAELYFVEDRKEKDRSNRHIIIIALNNDGIRDLNRIVSQSFIDGFYYKPRIDEELLFSINPDNVVITTACVAGVWNNEKLISLMKNYFKDHLFLEVQSHNENTQKEVNKKILELSKKYGIKIIHANDSHYILPEDATYREKFLKAKGINYPEELNFILDYPDYDTIVKRYKEQKVLNEEQIYEALNNTLIFENVDCSNFINDDIKLPSISKNPNEDLKKILNQSWDLNKKIIPVEKRKEYLNSIRYEMDIIEKTNMANYFLIDYYISKIAKEKYGGVLTKTGRGSAPSFYITNLLHLTNIDRLASPIKLFPTRFMSIERILGARSLPDIDLNTADAEPFIKASQDLLGEDNCAWMISWKPLQESSAFRLYCKSLDLDFEEVNKVGKDLDKYREDEKWKQIIEDSKPFIGVIEGVAESPCFVEGTKIKTSNGYKNIENLNTSDLVLTHNNQYRQVIRTMSHEVDSVIELKNMGSLPIKTTFNHPFYIRKHIGRKYFLENNKYKSIRKFTNPYWEQASNLTKGDYIGMPVNFKSIIPQWENLDLSDENIWWIIGRCIGDGWLRLVKKGKNHGQSYHTLICCNKNDNEQQEIEERISKCFNYTKTEENTTYRYDISLKSLYSYLEKFGKGAKEKHLIEDVYDLPVYLLKAFLEGYQSADGYSPKNRKDIFYTSISYDLILGLQNCIHKCYKVPTTIVCRKKENIKHSVLSDGRKIVAKNDVYILSFRLNSNKYNGFFEDNYMWLPFRYKKEIIENNIVYNISVKDDESYTVNNIAVHNCSMVLYDKDVRSEIGMIKTPNGKICCLLDGYNCDKYKYLKNDYLTVTVWAIVRDVCKLAGIEIPSINELNNLLDKQTFDIYKNGLTCTINQADSDYATNLVTKYKPQNLAEMSSFVAIIRPGCASLLDDFISRKPYTTGVDALDNILEDSGHRLIYQESIMKYLIWLGISEPQSYDIIKKIAKKKFKEQELKELKAQLLQGWEKQVGSEEGFEETWKVVEDAAKYSFNACVSGDTIIKQSNSSKDKNLTVKEMFNIHNKKSTIYGNAFSMYNDKKIHENKIINIYYSGKADIYRVTTENGSYIDCTLNHKFPTDNGKIRLDSLNIGDELYVLDKEIKSSKDLLVKKDKIISIKFLRNDDVYDIEMASPAHNFISITGLITSNSHSLSYAYDSLYGAYLKSHYPLEYYTVALNYYQNDIDRTMKLTKELSYFGITLNNARFRYSKDDYFMDKKSKKIYKGTSSIKFLNKDCSNYLYTLKDKHYNNFIDLLIEIENAKDEEGKSYINSKQMSILIQLQYFEEFGKNKKLLEIYKYFKDIYGRKMLAKSKLADMGIKESDITECYEKETEKQYINIKPYKILLNIMERIPNENIPIKEQISFEEEIIGYIGTTYDVDKKYCYILDVDTKYSPKVTLYSLGTGKEVVCKINKFIYKDQPIKKGQIIQCGRFFQKERQIKTEKGWEKTNVMDWWLSSYNIVEKLEI